MVLHVPVCTYAHVGEDNMQFAECVYKKKWDRDQTGRVTRAVRAEEKRERGRHTRKDNASAAFSGRFSPI